MQAKVGKENYTMLKVFLQQIKRTYYVVHLDSTTYDAYPAFDLFSIVHGYKLCEN